MYKWTQDQLQSVYNEKKNENKNKEDAPTYSCFPEEWKKNNDRYMYVTAGNYFENNALLSMSLRWKRL